MFISLQLKFWIVSAFEYLPFDKKFWDVPISVVPVWEIWTGVESHCARTRSWCKQLFYRKWQTYFFFSAKPIGEFLLPQINLYFLLQKLKVPLSFWVQVWVLQWALCAFGMVITGVMLMNSVRWKSLNLSMDFWERSSTFYSIHSYRVSVLYLLALVCWQRLSRLFFLIVWYFTLLFCGLCICSLTGRQHPVMESRGYVVAVFITHADILSNVIRPQKSLQISQDRKPYRG